MAKTIFKLVLMLTFLLSGMGMANADDPDCIDISLYCVKTDSDSGDIIEIDPKGPRCPAAPLFCSISKVGGIQISGVENADIVSFEILDAYGNTVAELADEASFIDTLFSLKGDFRIVFRFSDRSLAGWIEIA